MADEKIELSLTESFAKHKRNVLLVSSVIVILAVAGPDKVKIPFSGTDEGVPAVTAYFLLWGALFYFFSTFVIELLAVRARNVDAMAGEGGRFGERLTAALATVTSEAEEMTGFFSGLKEMHKRYSETIGSTNLYGMLEKSKISAVELEEKLQYIRKIVLKDNMPNIKVSEMDIMITSMSDLNSKLHDTYSLISRLKSDDSQQIENIQKQHKIFLDKLEYVGKEAGDLSERMDKISHRINVYQRIGFSTLETAVPVMMFLISSGICADGVVFGSHYTQKLRDRMPVVAEAQKLDAQTGTHIDGKP